MPALLIYGAAAFIGICVGSFLTCAFYRLPRGLSIWRDQGHQRSYCPHCRKILTTSELIPLVSWLLQGGRCRSCKAFIGWRYVLIEAITGVIFVGAVFLFRQSS